MFRLINVCTKKYLSSAAFKIGSALSFAAGLVCGLPFRRGADSAVSSSAMIAAAAPVIISIAIIVLNITKEWEFRTFANKLAVGHTKVKIFFAELFVALLAGAAVYALFGAGFAAASPKTVFGPRLVPILRISAQMALVGLSLCTMAAVISFICKTHNSALILSIAAIFVMFFISEQLYDFIYRNEINSQIYENYYSSVAADPLAGKYTDPMTGIAVERADFVPMRTVNLAKAAYALDPIGAFDLYANELYPYLDGGVPDRYCLAQRWLPLCSAGLIAALAGLGALAFRKKDVK